MVKKVRRNSFWEQKKMGREKSQKKGGKKAGGAVQVIPLLDPPDPTLLEVPTPALPGQTQWSPGGQEGHIFKDPSKKELAG